MSVRVFSEVDPLRTVVVHRPGEEVVRMTQFELEDLLFDDILSHDLAAQEHQILQEILGAEGAEVLEVAAVLEQALLAAPDESIEEMLARVCDLGGVSELAPVLAEWSADRLALALIRGVFWSELADAPTTLARIRARQQGQDHLALVPVPNLMFMRDACIAIYDRVVVGRMATDARSRESILVRFALRWGQGVTDLLFDDDDRHRHGHYRALEGGDVLVLSDRFLMIGCSERTTAQSIERVAMEALFPAFPHLESVYAVLMPKLRSVMHLDTILTQVDRKLFLGHVPMVDGGLEVARLTRDGPSLVEGASVMDVLRSELGDDVQLVPCGGDDPMHQKREQWTDGANAVCLSPGRIVLYSRNMRTRYVLRERFGFHEVALSVVEPPAVRAAHLQDALKHDRVVFTFSGSELSRARGGGRCLTMPLERS